MEKVKNTNCRKVLEEIQSSNENISESGIFSLFLLFNIYPHGQ